MKKNYDWLIVGMALFSMFFGAGNLIFPPSVGLLMGENWLPSAFGFALTGIGLPVLGVLTMNKVGSFKAFSGGVSKLFFTLYSLLLMTSVVFTNTPRTAATAYELGIVPNLGGFSLSPVLVSLVFFGFTLYIALNPSKAIDRIGKILTPTIVVITLSIIYMGVTNKIGTPGTPHLDINSFGFGFSQGYQTMDGIMAGLFSMVILSNLGARGYTKKSEKAEIIKKASIVTGLGLLVIYIGLFYLGATGNQYFPADISRSALVSNFVNMFLGQYGNLIFGVCVTVACLSTATALTMVVSQFFLDTYGFSYKKVAYVSCAISTFMANFGVDRIVGVAEPILAILYPITIVLIFVGIAGILEGPIRKNTIIVSGLVSILQVASERTDIKIIDDIYNTIPLASAGFAWVLPTLVVGGLSIYMVKNNEKKVILEKA